MRPDVLELLTCPSCGAGDLTLHTITSGPAGDTDEGLVTCTACEMWYPVEQGVLELLAPPLWYEADRHAFRERHAATLHTLSLDRAPPTGSDGDAAHDAQAKQQAHFDWYAANETQSYDAYERTPFWRAEDDLTFSAWATAIPPGSTVLDIGCAQGRSAFPFRDLDVRIVGIDISKRLVTRAVQRARAEPSRARFTFLVADASRLPVAAERLDVAIVYGVLHHLPDPGATCRDIHRILKAGGVYFGSENHQSVLRAAFDLLMRLRPLWYEEAGAEPLLSRAKFESWFAGLPCERAYSYSVVLPPHLFNLCSPGVARRVLEATDRLANAVPVFRRGAGLIRIEMRKIA